MQIRGFSHGLFAPALALALFAVLLAAPAAHAQLLQGGIDGNVVDSTQAAVIGARVSITNIQTNATRETVTNEAGLYSFPTVATGTYQLQATAPGFQTFVQNNVQVTANNVVRANVVLEVGEVTTTVTVEASAATLQTDRAEVRQEVNEKALKDLPIPLGRNYQMLFVTLPGFSPPRNAHSIPSNPSRSVQFSVNGTSRSNNNTRIDGASSTNIWLPHMTGYLPALESIETVNAVTNSMDAEQGLAGGAAINLTIKSGTNDIHGSAFEYHTNQKMKAYPWNNPRTDRKGKFIDNQYGGTIGGPIKKDKIFYFLSYEGRRESEFRSRIGSVPTAAMRSGDLSATLLACDAGQNCGVHDPMTAGIDGEGRLPFANNIIPESRFDLAAREIFNTGDWGLPNLVGSGDFGTSRNYVRAASTTFNRDTVDAKVNFNISDKLTSFVRFSMLDFYTTNPTLFGDLGGPPLHRTNSNPGTGFGNTYSGTLSATYVATPTFVIDGYFGYTLVDTNIRQARLDENLGWELLRIPGLQSDRQTEGGWPQFDLDGFDDPGISNAFQPYFRSDPQWQYVFNGNWTKGSHNIRFGTDMYLQNLNHNQPEFSGSAGGAQGGFRFREGPTSAPGVSNNDMHSFGAFLLGLPDRAGKIWQFPETYRTKTRFYSFYLRDRWQISPKLTMSYGFRWEIFPFPTRKERGIERFDFDNNKMWACGVGVVPKNCGIDIGKYPAPKPRIGLAYRVADDTVFRVGYGITNDPFNWARPLRTNYPIMEVQVLNSPTNFGWGTTLRDGVPVINEPDLGDGILDIATTAAVNTVDTNNLVRGYIQSWNATIEKRFGTWIASAGYVGTRSINQLAGLEQNWAPIDGGNEGRVLIPTLGRTVGTRLFGSLGTAKYDALQMKADRRFAGGVQIGTAFTWSHARGYSDEDSGDGPKRVGIPHLYNLNYGRLDEDVKVNFQFTAIAELPFGPNKRWLQDGPGAAILGGWQFNTLISRYGGLPFTITDSGSSLNAPGSSQFGDCISEPVKLGQTGQGSTYYDPSSFARVPNVAGQRRFGNCGVNNLTGPALFNMDAGLFRKFQVSERVDIQFRAELFNVTNTPHFSNPTSGVNSSSFMQVAGITNTGREGIDERTFRFGLRIGF